LAGECVLNWPGLGYGPLAGSCKHGGEPWGFGAMYLVTGCPGHFCVNL
jgi:hypothetical protein